MFGALTVGFEVAAERRWLCSDRLMQRPTLDVWLPGAESIGHRQNGPFARWQEIQ